MPEPRYKSIFAIGDIHGCNLELEALLSKLPLNRDTLVVFLGDYIDRGPESRQVIDTILELKRRVPVVALLGNHESMFLDFLDHPESSGAGLFILNGGTATIASYQTEPERLKLPPEHDQFFRSLKLSFETEGFFFVHAGVPDVPLSALNAAIHEAEMLWIRTPFLRSKYNWGKRIVHGHTPAAEPEILPNRINVDTGCVYNGHLTAVDVTNMKVYSVAKQERKIPAPTLQSAGPSRVAPRFAGAMKVRVPKDGDILEFETLNYNEFGLLIREPFRPADVRSDEGPMLKVGELITGEIGTLSLIEVTFTGIVVRTETRNDQVLYGIKLSQITMPGEELGS